MKSKVLLLAFLLITALSSLKVKADNSISMADLTVEFGSPAELQISITNDFVASGFQFFLSLPEGITIDCEEEDWDTTDRTKKFSVSGNYSDGLYKFSVLSLTGKTISGQEGPVLTINLTIAPTLESGDYKMEITEAIIFEDGSTKDYVVPDAYATIKVINDLSGLNVVGEDYVNGSNAIFSINGVRLNTIPEHGIIVVNGQKVLVK